jgi:hypothetical protein
VAGARTLIALPRDLQPLTDDESDDVLEHAFLGRDRRRRALSRSETVDTELRRFARADERCRALQSFDRP